MDRAQTMRNMLLKLLGVNLEEIRAYNALKQRDYDMAEFKRAENDIRAALHTTNKKTTDRVLYCLRQFSEQGFPVGKYKDLSDKYKFFNQQKYEKEVRT